MINRKVLMRCLIASVILSLAATSGCAQRDTNSNSQRDINSNSDVESGVIVYETESEASSDSTVMSIPDTSTVTEKKVKIEAEVKSYEDGILCFEYENNEYSLPMTKDQFENEEYIRDNIAPNISERIINNKFGEKVFAKIALNENMDKIFLCDVINTNGKIDNHATSFDPDGTFNKDKLTTMKRTGKSLCEFSSYAGTMECDLNDLPLCMKLNYPETVFPVMLTIYRFNDDKVILLDLDINVQVDIDGPSSQMDLEILEMYGKHNGFFATVQTVNDDDTITVLLNDKVTYCIIPTYYNDGGEFVPGSEIMVLLDEDVDFFGTGGEHTYDYAVIVTNPGHCVDKDPIDEIPREKDPIENFNEYAYAVWYNSWYRLSCTRIDEIEKN